MVLQMRETILQATAVVHYCCKNRKAVVLESRRFLDGIRI